MFNDLQTIIFFIQESNSNYHILKRLKLYLV